MVMIGAASTPHACRPPLLREPGRREDFGAVVLPADPGDEAIAKRPGHVEHRLRRSALSLPIPRWRSVTRSLRQSANRRPRRESRSTGPESRACTARSRRGRGPAVRGSSSRTSHPGRTGPRRRGSSPPPRRSTPRAAARRSPATSTTSISLSPARRAGGPARPAGSGSRSVPAPARRPRGRRLVAGAAAQVGAAA